MPVPTLQTLRKLKLAARLRVEGELWRSVAKHIGRRNELSAQRICQEYPDLWHQEYEAAREAYLNSTEAEALLTQRELLRTQGGDGGLEEVDARRIRQSAAHSLLAHTAKMRAQKVEVFGGLDHNHFHSDGPMDWRAVETKWAEAAAQREAKAVESVIVNRLPPPGGNGGTH